MKSDDLWPIEEVNETVAEEIIMTKTPLGKFVNYGITGVIAIDNRKGKASYVLFENKEEAENWLNDRRG